MSMNKPLRVLVVDDDKSICRWLNAVLTAEGYECRVVRSVEDAEPLLHEGPIDLALLDIYIGEANGIEFMEKLKSLQPECKCVMMTAHASVETVARSVSGGALEYLSKPLLIDELLGLLRKLTGPRQTPSPAPKDSFAPESAIIGRSPKMLELYLPVPSVPPPPATDLITPPSSPAIEHLS